MIELKWNGGLQFEADPPSGGKFILDNLPELGGSGLGPSPLEALLSSLAACTAMDVVSILEKKRQKITAYRIEIEGDRPPQNEYPRPFTAIRLKHFVEGEGVDPIAVKRAIELSEEKYCSVAATLRTSPLIESTFEIAESKK